MELELIVPVDHPEDDYPDVPMQSREVIDILCNVDPNRKVHCIVQIDGKRLVGEITDANILEDMSPILYVTVPDTGRHIH